MTTLTQEQFEQKLEEQKLEATKWRELETGQIYTITDVQYIDTQYGEACIIQIGDKKVWAPSGLAKRLKDNKPLPRYVRPTGLIQSKQNKSHSYHGFDLV